MNSWINYTAMGMLIKGISWKFSCDDGECPMVYTMLFFGMTTGCQKCPFPNFAKLGWTARQVNTNQTNQTWWNRHYVWFLFNLYVFCPNIIVKLYKNINNICEEKIFQSFCDPGSRISEQPSWRSYFSNFKETRYLSYVKHLKNKKLSSYIY